MSNATPILTCPACNGSALIAESYGVHGDVISCRPCEACEATGVAPCVICGSQDALHVEEGENVCSKCAAVDAADHAEVCGLCRTEPMTSIVGGKPVGRKCLDAQALRSAS